MEIYPLCPPTCPFLSIAVPPSSKFIPLTIEFLLILQDNNKKTNENKKPISILFKNFLRNNYRFCGIFYLYNPIIIYLCACGIADSFTLLFFIGTLILIELNLYYIAALFYAMVVHLAMFSFSFVPLIYF